MVCQQASTQGGSRSCQLENRYEPHIAIENYNFAL